MSCAAVLLVKSEEDIIEHTVRHLVTQVDEVLVWDNMSDDNTRPILDGLAAEGLPVVVFDDTEIAYEQSRKVTAGAHVALERGHTWGVFADADEHWGCADYSRPIREFLNGLAPDIRVVTAELFNHIPSALDPPARCDKCETEPDEEHPCPVAEPNPFRRIGWRQRSAAPLPKVAARLHPSLVVRQGNHSCYLDGQMQTIGGLVCRHFSWRSEDQYWTKIRNGAAAYAETNFPEGVGGHWRMFGNPPNEEAVRDHFWRWFYCEDPLSDASLIFDPAPIT